MQKYEDNCPYNSDETHTHDLRVFCSGMIRHYETQHLILLEYRNRNQEKNIVTAYSR